MERRGSKYATVVLSLLMGVLMWQVPGGAHGQVLVLEDF